MKVLIACEFSGRVRDAFKACGHDAWSCDLKDTIRPGKHIKGDVREVLYDNWDLMIAHPDCTFLAVSNNNSIKNGCELYTKEQAKQYVKEAIDFFMLLVNAPIPRIAIENPVGRMSTEYRKPDQIIQPWQFGDNESKATCLWLKNLPLLRPTHKRTTNRQNNQTATGQNRLSRYCWANTTEYAILNRKEVRALTYQGIAKAMSNQWSNVRFEQLLEDQLLAICH